MASRFGPSSLHQRDPHSALFQSYIGDRNRGSAANNASSPNGAPSRGGGNGYGGYPGAPGTGGGFRPATPNSRGQYSDAVLSELENQNEAQIEGMSAKVKMLKDITLAISSEITSSTSLADNMNDSFDNTRVRLRGTMNRMLRMAERTGVGWRVWLLFLLAVAGIFWWVWLF